MSSRDSGAPNYTVGVDRGAKNNLNEVTGAQVPTVTGTNRFGEQYRRPVSQHHNEHTSLRDTNVHLNTAPIDDFAASGQELFVNVPLNNLDISQTSIMEFTMTNNHATDFLVVSPGYLMIDRIEIRGPGGQGLLQCIRGESEYWNSLIMLSPEELHALKHDLGYNPWGSNPKRLPPASVPLRWRLPLLQSFLHTNDAYMRGLFKGTAGSELQFRVVFKTNVVERSDLPAPATVKGTGAATQANLRLSDLQVRTPQIRVNDLDRTALDNVYDDLFLMQFFEWELYQDSFSILPGATDPTRRFLHGANGLVPAIFFTLTDQSAAQPKALRTPLKISAIDITDASGKSHIGTTKTEIPMEYIKRMWGTLNGLVEKASERRSDLGLFTWSNAPLIALATGQLRGGFEFKDGNDQLEIRLAATGDADTEIPDVHTCTWSVAPLAADLVHVHFMGRSTPAFRADTALASVNLILEETFAETGMEITVGAVLTTDPAVFTIRDFKQHVPSHHGHLIHCTDDLPASAATTVTQVGRPGAYAYPAVSIDVQLKYWLPVYKEIIVHRSKTTRRKN